MPDDGSGGGDGEKMVPERDLLAVKRSLNAKIQTLETERDAAKQALDDKHQELLRVTASLTDVESKLNKAQGQMAEVDGLKTQLTEATTGRDEAVNTLTVLRRMSAAQVLKVDVKTLEGKTDDQLSAMLEGAELVGKGKDGAGGTPSSKDLAGGGTGGKSFEGLTPREKIRTGLEIQQQSK